MGPYLLRVGREGGRRGRLAGALAARPGSEPWFSGLGPRLRRRPRYTFSHGARIRRRRRGLFGRGAADHTPPSTRSEDAKRGPHPRPALPRRPSRNNRRGPLSALFPLASNHKNPRRHPPLPRTRRPPARPLRLHAGPLLPCRKETKDREQLLPRRGQAQALLRRARRERALRGRLGAFGSRRAPNKQIRRREARLGSRRKESGQQNEGLMA